MMMILMMMMMIIMKTSKAATAIINVGGERHEVIRNDYDIETMVMIVIMKLMIITMEMNKSYHHLAHHDNLR